MGLSHPVASRMLLRAGNLFFRVAGCSMQGFRPEMEDAEAIHLTLPNHPNVAFFGVFDGHNGSAASKWSAQRVPEYLDRLDEFTPEKIQQALLQADADFLQTDTKHHGTTAVFALVDASGSAGRAKPWKLIVGNVGDSRILLWRDNKTIALTKDHKPTNEPELARIRAAGGFVDWGRVDGQLALSRAIGDVAYKENKALPLDKQRVIALPDITIEEIREGDVMLVCCDGIFEAFSNEEAMSTVASLLTEHPEDPVAAVSKFLDQTLKKGSKDNMTALAVEFIDGSQYGKAAEYVPGPFNANKNDRGFVEAYTRNARIHGFTLEQCLEMNGEAPNSSADPTPDEGGAADASNGLSLNYDASMDDEDSNTRPSDSEAPPPQDSDLL